MFGKNKSNTKLQELKNLLILQNNHQLKETKVIWDFVLNNYIGKDFGGKALSTDYPIMNIMNEWKSMFSYPSGFMQGISIIIALLDFVMKNPSLKCN